MTDQPQDGSIPFDVIYERPGCALVAETDGLALSFDLHGLGVEGGLVLIDALVRQRARRPRPRVVIAMVLVGEEAPGPSARERAIGREIGEHCSSFVGVMEGNGIRVRWARGIVASIARFSPRRTPTFMTRSVAEGAVIAARELGIDVTSLGAGLAALRTRVADPRSGGLAES